MGKIVLLDLLDMMRMLQRCNIPGLGDASAQLHVDHATGAAAPQAVANLFANDATAEALRVGAAAGGTGPPRLSNEHEALVNVLCQHMTTITTAMDNTSTSNMNMMVGLVKELKTDVLDAQQVLRTELKREQEVHANSVNAALQAEKAAQAEKDAAIAAEFEALKREKAEQHAAQAEKDAATAAKFAEFEKYKAEQAAMVLNCPMAVEVVPQRQSTRKRNAPATYEPGASSQPRRKPARDPVADRARFDYATKHWTDLVLPVEKDPSGVETFVWITDMIEQLEVRGVPGDLTIPQVKILMKHHYGAKQVPIEHTVPGFKNKFHKVGFKGYKLMDV